MTDPDDIRHLCSLLLVYDTACRLWIWKYFFEYYFLESNQENIFCTYQGRYEFTIPNTYNAGDPSTIMSSSVTIEEVYKEVKKIRADMVRREDLEALADTVEILSNPATMQLIRKSDEDIQRGRVKEISSVDDLLRECS